MSNISNNNKITLDAIAAATNAKLNGDGNRIAIDITHDSRQAGENWLFVAIRGLTTDGHRFVPDVLRRSAVGIVSELEKPANFDGSWLTVENARVALAQAANVIHGEPSRKLNLIGVTGTNGKTTTTYLTHALAEAAGKQAAMLTTVEYRIGEKSEPAIRTTPEASDTQRFLRKALEAGCSMAAMEASSQALDLHRCDALRFEAAIFTNLTRDHLDYHGTMENYFDAKKRLFDGRLGEAPNFSVINVDDRWGAKLAAELKNSGQKVVTFALDSETDLTASEIEISILRGTSFRLKTPGGETEIRSPLVGRPHVYNILSATGAALALGYNLEQISAGIKTCVGAPGRFERVESDADFAVVVDYAHTDDALENVLKTARDLGAQRVITVFGAGGDRDRTKRAPMGEIAGRYSDFVVLTSDNPRTEDPLKILDEIEVGLKQTNCSFVKNPDRREAIYAAIKQARAGDLVLIAGKGHETYQIIGSEKFHFDDREIAREVLHQLEE
ncbi:MAG: UDP-N-acetylmuramoyl-L-alanyl-D-glutamate--2,6-diaminopimelate ligase [Acidobacteriota bacterium]|nr:UDP-N-acetylmuramoyl-L-alanyl-D-glutamate--2,6-diaminopimelate ligase [Acidobacteriota bacterium]